MYIFRSKNQICTFAHHSFRYSHTTQNDHHTKYDIGITPIIFTDVSAIHELLIYPEFRLFQRMYSTVSFVYLAESIHVLPPRFTSVAHHSLNAGAF
jgi:hypothetical protein